MSNPTSGWLWHDTSPEKKKTILTSGVFCTSINAQCGTTKFDSTLFTVCLRSHSVFVLPLAPWGTVPRNTQHRSSGARHNHVAGLHMVPQNDEVSLVAYYFIARPLIEQGLVRTTTAFTAYHLQWELGPWFRVNADGFRCFSVPLNSGSVQVPRHFVWSGSRCCIRSLDYFAHN